MKRLFAYGGVAASVVLIAFGIGSLIVGINGRNEVRDTIAREKIVGTPDMTPAGITAQAWEAGLNVNELDIPSVSVAGETIDTGDEAKAFAGYMRIHALEDTGGQVYAEMPRFLDENGRPTHDQEQAATDPETGEPVSNPARQTWITETALATALNTSFFAERVALWSIVMGIALLLTGIGFLVLALSGALGALPIPGRRASPRAASTST